MRITPMLQILLLAGILCACSPDSDESFVRPPIENPGEMPDEDPGSGGSDPDNPPQMTHRIKITIDAAIFEVTPAENPAAAAFVQILPMTVTMDELNGNEKYYNLPYSLPAAASAPGTIRNGDLMLFGTSTLVLFYKTFQSPYSYTLIGRIDDPSGLETALGQNSSTVKFEKANE